MKLKKTCFTNTTKEVYTLFRGMMKKVSDFLVMSKDMLFKLMNANPFAPWLQKVNVAFVSFPTCLVSLLMNW